MEDDLPNPEWAGHGGGQSLRVCVFSGLDLMEGSNCFIGALRSNCVQLWLFLFVCIRGYYQGGVVDGCFLKEITGQITVAPARSAMLFILQHYRQ